MSTVLKDKICLDVPFKGERTYLRGSDIFNEFLKRVSRYDYFSMIMRRKMVGEVSLEPIDTSAKHNDFSGLLTCKIDGKTYDFGLAEDTSTPVTSRVPYDEKEATAGYEIDITQNTIALSAEKRKHSFMDTVVALNKALLNQCLSNQVKWAFSKLELTELPSAGTIKLQMINHIGHVLVKSAIYVDDVYFGDIYFSDFSGDK